MALSGVVNNQNTFGILFSLTRKYKKQKKCHPINVGGETVKKENKKTNKRSKKSSSRKSTTSKSSVNNMNYEIAKDMGLNSRESCSNDMSSRSRRENSNR